MLEFRDGTSIPTWSSIPALVVGVSTLAQLGDVSLSTLSDGQQLTYSVSSNSWINADYQLPNMVSAANVSTTIMNSDKTQGITQFLALNLSDTTFLKILTGSDTVGPAISAAGTMGETNIPLSIIAVGSGDITLDASGGGDIHLEAATTYATSNLDVNATLLADAVVLKSTSHAIQIKAPSILGADYTLKLPVDGGSNGQVLTTNGSGTLSWTNASGGSSIGSSSNGQILFNSNGSVGGMAALTQSGSNVALTAGANFYIGATTNALTGNSGFINLQTTTGGHVSLNSKFVLQQQTPITIADASIPGSFTIDYSIIYIMLTDGMNSGLTALYTVSASSPTQGQHLHIFFDNLGINTNKVELDFGTNGLAAGGGYAQYMTFESSGQSSSMIYIGTTWRVINTGATIS
jgi:hypothetical protein